MVTAATIYMTLLGAQGLQRVAEASWERTDALIKALQKEAGVKLAFHTPHFHEVVLLLDRSVAPVLVALASRGIFGWSRFGRALPRVGPGSVGVRYGNKNPGGHRRLCASFERHIEVIPWLICN